MFNRPLSQDQLREFEAALQAIVDIYSPGCVFAADDIITLDRHVGFGRDRKFVEALLEEATSPAEQSLAWRFHVLCWAGDHARFIPGDFVQFGVQSGLKAAMIARYVDLAACGKRFRLYDPVGAEAMAMDGGGELRRQRLSAMPGVVLEEGQTAAALIAAAPATIALLHLDLSQADDEAMALQGLIDRVSPGGLVIVEQYGSNRFADRVEVADRIAAAHRCAFLELPTGQGLLIKG